MIALLRTCLFCCYGFLLFGVHGFAAVSAIQHQPLHDAQGRVLSTPVGETRLQSVEFSALKALTESSVLGTSVPPAPFLKRKVEAHSPAIQHKEVVILAAQKRLCERAASIKEQFGVPDLIFPFHYFP